MGAGPPRHQLFTGHDATNGHTATNTFGKTYDIGLHTFMLNSPPFARTTGAALNFVGDQQDAILVANGPQAGEEVGCRDYIAAFSLDWLYQNAGHVGGVDQILEKLVL